MSLVVLDASVAIAWFVATQSTPSADDLLNRVAVDEFLAPYVFRLEVPNVFVVLERRGVLKGADLARALSELDGLDIGYEGPPRPDDLPGLVMFARNAGLTLFDAMYLDLAIRRGAALASRDANLLTAASGYGVETLDLRG